MIDRCVPSRTSSEQPPPPSIHPSPREDLDLFDAGDCILSPLHGIHHLQNRYNMFAGLFACFFFSSVGLQDLLRQGIYSIQFTFEVMMMYVPQIIFIYFKFFLSYHQQVQGMWRCGKSYSVDCLFEELLFFSPFFSQKLMQSWEPSGHHPNPFKRQ